MRNLSIVLCMLATTPLMSQKAAMMFDKPLNKQVLFTVEDDTVTAGEYIAVYNKNRNLGEDIDPKTPREYLDLYINFKLKVHDAKAMGLDTIDTFIREYTSYRSQLAKPYLSDRDVTDDLIKEAYERMQYDVRASHIMVAVPEEAEEEEVAAAREKMAAIQKELENGADFASVAEKISADTYSAQKGGDLGYFTVFNMVYPFESEVYKLKIGEISTPVRTKFGYHLIKKTGQRKARGTIKVAHIMIIENEETALKDKVSGEKKINEIYDELQNGADFAALAQTYSEDQSTAARGGELQEFGINKMFPQFEEVAFNLEQPGDYSKPFKTPVGWHIVKLIEKKDLPDLAEINNQLKSSVERDIRSQQSRESIIKRLKLEYGYKEYPKVRQQAFAQVGDDYLQKKYSAREAKYKEKVLFEFADVSYTIGDFLSYLEISQTKSRMSGNLKLELKKAYNTFSESKLIAYEKEHLEEKYPEFRMLSREYYEGILLFDLTEKKVWKKSVADTSGLQDFYLNHKDRYRWDTRYDVVIIKAASEKLAKKAGKMLKKGKTVETIEEALNEDSELNVQLESGVFERKNKGAIDQDLNLGRNTIIFKDGRYQMVFVKAIVDPTTKTLDEARGVVISDYQNYLEQQWIEKLKSEYDVQVNQEVLRNVIDILEKE